MKKVVILIPAYKEKINHFEEISLRQCFKILKKHPITLICPEGLDISCYKAIIPDIKFDFLDSKWFKSDQAYSKLLIADTLYRKYSDYQFIMIYHLDAFVFRDELTYWCNKNYDYIGAPWFKGFHRPKKNKFIGVGNGGFSLRKTKSCLKASLIYKRKGILDKIKFLDFKAKIFFLSGLLGIKETNYVGHPDLFWGIFANRNLEWFKVPDPNEALKFSFEINPRLIFKLNSHRLPFGCHAWPRYDLNFWKPFIEKEGYYFDF